MSKNRKRKNLLEIIDRLKSAKVDHRTSDSSENHVGNISFDGETSNFLRENYRYSHSSIIDEENGDQPLKIGLKNSSRIVKVEPTEDLESCQMTVRITKKFTQFTYLRFLSIFFCSTRQIE